MEHVSTYMYKPATYSFENLTRKTTIKNPKTPVFQNEKILQLPALILKRI